MDEETVRRIVRDELRKLLMEMQEQAARLDRPYSTEELDSRVYQGVVEVVRETGRTYHPLPHCPRRTEYRNDTCLCGVADTKET